ncbi:SH3 domain-containing protein [Metabacillus rhizolycopersici]|uniref:SH3 domain-containing protein n=1 Tax=Metabacillus rhizolycopersici TaxID=2875709 RepID=A0ABS7UXY7_9BACI|nr:SH3 domain-containing protein [Metabacillus rhizolycopersici]MBZ5753186.1 SH3 domain-containing protein [Metabacillus rhizolycopersici]
METIINQLFWLWVPLSFLPVWLRIAIVTYLIIMLIRPIICRLVPTLIHWASRFVIKGIELISYPVMVCFYSLMSKKRQNDNHQIPGWIEFIEDIFSFSIKGLTKFARLFQLRRHHARKVRKGFRIAGLFFAVIIPIAILNNPTESYAKTWQRFETWVTEEKVEKALGYQLNHTEASVEEITTSTKISLTERFKEDGANIRETPSLNGVIIENLRANETVTFLDEENTDESGIKWLKVETDTGVIGWVSSRIVEEQ